MLAIHPAHQDRVFDEIYRVIGHKHADEDITRAELDMLCYTEQCLRETMRMYPIVPIIARENKIPITLQNVTIPTGTSIVICIPKLHKDPRYWGDDAHFFNPDRFLPENISKIHPFAYLGFSAGPRNCIGLLIDVS